MDWKNQTPNQVRQWLGGVKARPTGPTAPRAEDQRALQNVENLIAQLGRMGVPPPAELLQQRDQVKAKINELAERLEVAECDLVNLEGLIAEYSDLLKMAREKREELRRVSLGGKKKHFGVSLSDLISAHYLSPKDELELRWLRDGPTFKGLLCDDGSILVETKIGWKRYDSLSTAASEIAGRSLNGWEVWSRTESHGKRTKMLEIRQKYLEANGS
jgi:hypothetical protein